jgi:hypothetical protein
MKSLYLLIVDKAWAKLYKTTSPADHLTLVYHQALFVGRPGSENGDEELAKSLCRLLRADRQMGKFGKLVMLASSNMLAALCGQYDGDWDDVVVGLVDDLPARYIDEDLDRRLRHLLGQQASR